MSFGKFNPLFFFSNIQLFHYFAIYLNSYQFLLKEELKNKESLSLEKAPCLYLLTYDIHFDRLPDEVKVFDLIEGKEKEGTTSFNFYSVNLN